MPSLAFDAELARSAGQLLGHLEPIEEASSAVIRLLDESVFSRRFELAGAKALGHHLLDSRESLVQLEEKGIIPLGNSKSLLGDRATLPVLETRTKGAGFKRDLQFVSPDGFKVGRNLHPFQFLHLQEVNSEITDSAGALKSLPRNANLHLSFATPKGYIISLNKGTDQQALVDHGLGYIHDQVRELGIPGSNVAANIDLKLPGQFRRINLQGPFFDKGGFDFSSSIKSGITRLRTDALNSTVAMNGAAINDPLMMQDGFLSKTVQGMRDRGRTTLSLLMVR